MPSIYTYLGSEESPQLAGIAYASSRRGRVATSFAYDQSYLQHREAYALDPELELQTGNWPLARELPGSFADASPDRWGRNLIRKRFAGRTLTALDYLLETSDATRQGALRFKIEPHGAFLHPEAHIPKLVSLPELLDASAAIDSTRHGLEAVRFLLQAGTASLGGARPKAVVEDKGRLFLAKFPHEQDETDIIGGEFRALEGAAQAGINTPPHRLVKIGSAQVLLVERFDRHYLESATTVGTKPAERRGYISAMTALGAADGEQRDYLDIIDFLMRFGSQPRADIQELLRRIRYTLAINNTDDHLRNHGFLREKGGWRLSPVFDLDPNPLDGAPRQTALAGTVYYDESIRALEQLETEWSQ